MVNGKYISYECGRCGAHMKLVPGKYSYYYRCEKYEFQHRVADDKVCTNRISIRSCHFIEEKIKRVLNDDDTTEEFSFFLDKDKEYYEVHVDNTDMDLIHVTVNLKRK